MPIASQLDSYTDMAFVFIARDCGSSLWWASGAHWVSQRVDTPRYPIIGVPIETDPLTELFLETSSSETKVFGVHHFLHSLLPRGWKYRLDPFGVSLVTPPDTIHFGGFLGNPNFGT